MKKKTVIITGVILIVTVILSLRIIIDRNNGSSSEPPAAETCVEVKTVKPVSASDTLIFEAQGRVTPQKSFSVTALSEGKIKKVYVSEGEYVKKGQLIALIENKELDSELSFQNDKQLLSRKTVEDIEQKVKNSEEMLKLGIISESDLISIKQELNARKTEANDQEITGGRLKIREKNYRIITDTEGYITNLLPEQSFVTFGQTVAGVISLKDEQIEAFVPFDMENKPSYGDNALISSNNLTVSGKVLSAFPSANSNLIKIIVVPEKPVPMNLDVKVSFRIRIMKGFMIPKTAVVLDEGKPVIFVVKNNKAYKKVIKAEKDYLDKVFIADGIKPDDVIVAENAYLLSDQVNVTVK